MTELLEQAIEQVKSLAADKQEVIATIIIEELRDETEWDAAFANSQNLLADLAAEAMAEHDAGCTYA
jgi:aspartate/glutamate racemase